MPPDMVLKSTVLSSYANLFYCTSFPVYNGDRKQCSLSSKKLFIKYISSHEVILRKVINQMQQSMTNIQMVSVKAVQGWAQDVEA